MSRVSTDEILRRSVARLTERLVEHVRRADHPIGLPSPLKTWAPGGLELALPASFMPRRTFLLVDRPVPDVQHIADRDRAQIESWPECQAVQEALRSPAYDRWLSPRGGETPASIDPYRAATFVSIGYCQDKWRQDWDEMCFEMKFTELMDALTKTHFEIELVCPLTGFVSEHDIVLSNELAICRLDDARIIRLLDFGFGEMHRFGGLAPSSAEWMWTHAAVLSYESHSALLGQPMEREEVWLLLVKLHAFKTGKVALAGGMARWKSPFASAAAGWHNADKGYLGSATYRLSSGEVTQLIQFSKDIDRHLADVGAKKGEKRRLELCLSRLSAASSRESDSDRLLDCCNIAELLFSDGPGSIAYKVAMRSAVAAHGPQWSGQDVFRVISAGYDYRNRLAHGGGEDPPRDIIDKFEMVLRWILRRALVTPNNPVNSLRAEVEARIAERLYPSA